MRGRARAFAQRDHRAFYWRVVLPVQSVLLTAFVAPVYGFNAVIQPVNAVFSPENVTSGWTGAVAGGLLFSSAGFGALAFDRLLRIAKTRPRLLVWLSVALFGCFIVGAIACRIESPSLLYLGFAVPTGLVLSNLYSLCVSFVVPWASRLKREGLQAGVVGFMFGAWAAAYSFVAPIVVRAIGLQWLLVLSGALVLLTSLLASMLYHDPPPEPPPPVGAVSAASSTLTVAKIVRLPVFWVFAAFLVFFMAPGFGFKLIVHALSNEVFHASESVASMVAVAFFVTYGVARLVFGTLADKVPLRPMYYLFCGVQAAALVVAAFVLPQLHGVAFFAGLMCVVGGAFAAGQVLWILVVLKIYGPTSFHAGVRAYMPAIGVAGILGPLTLNAALRGSHTVTAVSVWLFVAAACVAVCAVLVHVLRRVDYTQMAAGQRPGLRLRWRSKDEFDRF
jgi:nitrate/nitrite transporter NarK